MASSCDEKEKGGQKIRIMAKAQSEAIQSWKGVT